MSEGARQIKVTLNLDVTEWIVRLEHTVYISHRLVGGDIGAVVEMTRETWDQASDMVREEIRSKLKKKLKEQLLHGQ